MFCCCLVVLAVASQNEVFAAPLDSFIEDTELIFAFMIHRHGDRTPLSAAAVNSFSSDPHALLKACEPIGYQSLTVQGKRRAYRMGQFIRRRYNSLISSQYNASEIYIHSTDVTRTKMSVLVAMSAVFPSTVEDNWSSSIAWDPVPYTTNAVENDPNMAIENCPAFLDYFITKGSSLDPTFDKYNDTLAQTSAFLNLPFDLRTSPFIVFSVYDVLQIQKNFGLPLSTELENIFPQIEEVAGHAFEVLLSDNEISALTSGVLLQEFLNYSTSVINGSDTPRVRVYSSHDINVFAFETILQLTPKQGAPRFSSLLSLELRRDSTGKVFVLPVYLPTPEEPEMYLQVEGCDGLLCSWDQFKDITSKHALDIDTWRRKCNLPSENDLHSSSHTSSHSLFNSNRNSNHNSKKI